MTILLSSSSDSFYTDVFSNHTGYDPIRPLQNKLAAPRRDQPG
ncbi:hypothetical protein [Pantoea alfalfae]|nr:hypothetical protein [Pantoea alfalfae]